MAAKEVIAIREFARRVGVSDTAVRKHIKAGHLKECVTQLDNGRPGLIADIAFKEWEAWGGGSHAASYVGGKRSNRQAPAADQSSSAGGQASAQQMPAMDTSMAAAKRAQAIYIAKIKELEYKEKLGKLVDKDQVYSSLFAAGKELRSALQAIPDRIIDDLLACQTRIEAHTMLYEAIAEALEKLSDINTRKLTE